MQVGKIEQLTTEKPPRTMPRTLSIAPQKQQLEAEYLALLNWSRRAYMRLNGLMELRVSISPDVVTASIVNEAPDSVKGGAA